jgi:hypothetical protein
MPVNSALLDSAITLKVFDWIRRWWQIDILVVTDTIVSFGPEHNPNNLNETYFGMSHLIGVLESVGSVTKAHRGTDPLGAPGVISNFQFDTHDLSGYDQIWLIGWDSSASLSTAEQDAVCRFMNKGGGVFATGDHAALGSSLASSLPRVRSMRHWNAPPPPLGPTRVDTTMPDHQGVVVFENQSDDIPQKLRLKWYTWGESYFARQVYPHPLLCSQTGAITEFPDHMHEGEVIEPTVLDAVMSAGGQSFDEYPADSQGNRVAPEIVAWGWTEGYADPQVMTGVHVGDPGTSNKRWTGTVGAYDGKRAGVGRVVVDSTWHHFFDINLIGDNAANRPSFTDPRKNLWSKGFTYSADGQRILSKIDQYYRNIVNWLSPGVGLAHFGALATELAMSKHIIELLDGEITAIDLGRYAWEIAIRRYPPCMVIELNRAILDSIPRLKPVPFGPWDWPYPGPDDGPPRPPVPPVELVQAALGAAILAVHEMGPQGLLSRSAIQHLTDVGLRGIREKLDSQIETTSLALKELERTAALFDG